MKPIDNHLPFGSFTKSSKTACDQFRVDKFCKANSPQSVSPEQLVHYEIIIVTRGTGELSVDLRKYPITDNTIYFLVPGQYRLLELSMEAHCYCLSLSPEFLHLSDSPIDRATNEWVSPSQPETEELVLRMFDEYQRNNIMRLEILRSLLKVFMIYLYRENQGSKAEILIASNDRLIVRKFFDSLQKQVTSKKLVSDYADELCITPNYLNAEIKKQTGFTASHHIQQHIVMEAKRQALYSNLRMKEVANRLGFDDYSHFSKYFKNYSGMNFSTFRSSIV